ncbi:MAG TPA: septal ring lytic transglycosylase RlpA family protein [Oculatellaceae cyanobacterium]
MKGTCQMATALVLVGLYLTSMPIAQCASKVTGKATIYSNRFQGRRTANGQIYRAGGMTGASNKFPLGSRVLVKNRKTGQHAVVTINDRTARSAHSSVDLSPAAARRAGIRGKGSVDATQLHR